MANSPLNDYTADRHRNRENAARLCHVSSRFRTDGQGTVEFEDRVEFGVTFVERPFIQSGWQIDLDQARDALDVSSNADVNLPQATGYVTEWDMTERDHYVGCWVAVSVSYSVEYPADAQVRIWHDFTWSAIALKDMPTELSG